MFTKHKMQQGVTLYTRKTDQFKTVNFAIKFKTALNEEAAAVRSVLANVLEHSNRQYTTERALRQKLDDLYGTVLFTDVRKRGTDHIFSVNMECVNDEYLNESAVLEEAIALLKTEIFEPHLANGFFQEDILTREKRTIIERIKSQYDNKTSYAQKRLLEHLRPNSPVSISADGSVEKIKAVTKEALTAAYEKMIAEDAIDLYVIGDIDEEEIAQQLMSLFTFGPRQVSANNAYAAESHVKSVEAKRIEEQQNMQQGKLHIAFCTPITFQHPDYMKMQVTNGIFGAFPHSKLFMNVREKESMAYYASSSYASHYGFVYAVAGIDAHLAGKAVQLIEAQLQAMQDGDITKLELAQTKALLNNSIRSAFDSARGQIEIYDQYKTLDEHFSAEYLIQEWEAVTIEDVQRMAQTMQLEMVYLLSGKEQTSDE